MTTRTDLHLFSQPRLSAALLASILFSACGAQPPTPAPPAELARGAYLVHHVVLCLDCHSQRDWSLYSGPPEPGTEGRGGAVGLFGSAEVAPDISPSALVSLSPEDVASALRQGTLPSGKRIHRGLRLQDLTALTRQDALAIARYLKTPDSAPSPAAPPSGAAGDPVETGRYLVTVGRCALCHGEDLSGGVEIEIPESASYPSANLTSDRTAGVGRMTRTEFIDLFKSLNSPQLTRVPVPPGKLNTAMPWPPMSGMTRDDLGAIHDYLMTVDPVPGASTSP